MDYTLETPWDRADRIAAKMSRDDFEAERSTCCCECGGTFLIEDTAETPVGDLCLDCLIDYSFGEMAPGLVEADFSGCIEALETLAPFRARVYKEAHRERCFFARNAIEQAAPFEQVETSTGRWSVTGAEVRHIDGRDKLCVIWKSDDKSRRTVVAHDLQPGEVLRDLGFLPSLSKADR